MRGLRGDLIVSSAAGPQCRFHNKAWWGTHGVAVVTHNSGHIFPTAVRTLFVDHNVSWLLSENQMHTSQRMYSVTTYPTFLLWQYRVDRFDWCGVHGVCLCVFFSMRRWGRWIGLIHRRCPQAKNEEIVPEIGGGLLRDIKAGYCHISQWSGLKYANVQSPMRQQSPSHMKQTILALFYSSWSLSPHLSSVTLTPYALADDDTIRPQIVTQGQCLYTRLHKYLTTEWLYCQ